MMPKSSQTRAGATGSANAISVSRFYKVSIEAAFDAWINPSSLEKWFGPPGARAEILTLDLRVGGDWRFLMTGSDGESFHHFGVYIEISPPHKLAFTWASEEQVEGWRDENGNPTLVTVDFESKADGVKVRITHEELQSDKARRALIGGWGGSLDCLSDFFQSMENS